MRSFATLLLSAVLVFSADAASIDKRAISSPTQLRIDGLNNVTNSYVNYKYMVDRYTSANFNLFVTLNHRALYLETQLNQKIISYGAVVGSFSAQEAVAVNQADSKINTQAIPCLTSIINKKPEFDAYPLFTNVTRITINRLGQRTEVLNACLVSKTPATHLDALNGYIAEIDGNYETVSVAYAVK